MAVFKCKICGGTLEINAGETVATCEYCGTKQTLPKLDDEKKANLFDRANHFRRNNDFDKAMGIYEQILNEDTEDAESYWSIVLCRYGIEYVEDPSSRKRVPTVNRAQFTSVFDDEDYKSAIKYADSYQKNIYESEAAIINEIQKGILAISQKEEPFDVFICYKETDNNGRRTQDSVLATELYHELTKEGFKVFFSRITLEDKLGVAYEPYIFAALHSAKVMVALGTKPEHFNAVWVKNEWSRYLSLIKNGANKILIPAYRDMDPYDLPEEFSHLQAQDMSKLGFMQDLVRGIKKLVSADSSSGVKETVVVQSTASGNASALVKRGFLALEDGEWEKADEFFEQALNQNAEDAQAYLGKLMAELKVSKEENLMECKEPFENMSNYQKALRFADDNLKKTLKGYVLSISKRNKLEQTRTTYASAMQKMKTATTEERFLAAATEFETISDYKNSKELAEECRQKAENAWKEEILRNANSLLDDSHHWIGKETDLASYIEAVEQLQRISGYKDADEKAVLCQRKVDEITVKLEEEKLQQERERKERERQAEVDKIVEAKRKRKNTIIIVSTVIIVAIIVFLMKCVILPPINYNKAINYINEGKYTEAYNSLVKAGSYKNSVDLRNDFVAVYGKVEVDGYAPTKSIREDHRDVYTYDDKGNCIKTVRSWNDGSEYTGEYTYTYDLSGNILKKTEKWTTGINETTEYTYDESGNILAEKITYKDGKEEVTNYSYDKNGNCISKVTNTHLGKATTLYTYDSLGNCVKEVYTNVQGNVETKNYTYDSFGNCIKESFDGGEKTIESIYNSKGVCIKRIYSDDYDTVTTKCSYDSNGNLIREQADEKYGYTAIYSNYQYFYRPKETK